VCVCFVCCYREGLQKSLCIPTTVVLCVCACVCVYVCVYVSVLYTVCVVSYVTVCVYACVCVYCCRERIFSNLVCIPDHSLSALTHSTELTHTLSHTDRQTHIPIKQ